MTRPCAESFFHTIKVELIHGERFESREEMRQAVFEYIEVDYNRSRRHSAIGQISPEAFEAKRSGPKKLDSRLRCIPLNRNLQDGEEKTVLT